MILRALIAAASAQLLLVPFAQATAASSPPPPKTLPTTGIDAHLGYKAQKTCSPAAKPGATRLLKALIATWGGSSSGISRFCSSGGTSEHKEGRALDWHMDSRKASDRAKVNQMIEWITSNNGEVAYRLGVMYIIWNQKIWSIYYQELGWRKMADRGSWTANHKDHVHISLSWDGAMAQTSWWTGKVLTVPKLGPCGTGNFGACLPVIGRSSSNTWTRVKVGAFSPYPSNVPAIAGSARVGLTLKLVRGTWVPSGATVNQRWMRDGKSIAGATGESYTLTAADVGHAITVRVRSTLGVSSVVKTSDETTDTVKGIFPTPRAKVTGSYTYGSTLTGAAGTGFPAGTKFSYQWQRDGKNISGASGATYKLKAADVGHDVRVRVQASQAGWITDYTHSSAKEVQPAAFTTTPRPTFDGITRVGGTLSVVTGAWSPAATSFSYLWYRSGTKIAGQTKSSYKLTDADLGETIKVRVTGTRAGYTSAYRYSLASDEVKKGMTSYTPIIHDTTPQVGQLLTIKRGVWQPEQVGYRYQWYRDGVAIAGATQRSYLVTASDYGKRLRVRVIGELDGYPTTRRESKDTAAVAAGQFQAGTVTISGTRSVGATLTANEGTWRSKNADVALSPTFTYQWYLAGKAVRGATAKTWVVTSAAKGAAVHVVVTAKATRYTTASAKAAAVTIAG